MQLPSISRSSRVLAFGVFRVDLSRRELLKHGLKVKIQDLPFQLMMVLLEKPGEVATREELRRRLWPADTFVSFDDGLNVAMQKLRGALSDSAEAPRYIETVPRQGYRFIAPVTGSEVAGFQGPAHTISIVRDRDDKTLHQRGDEAAGAESADQNGVVGRRSEETQFQVSRPAIVAAAAEAQAFWRSRAVKGFAALVLFALLVAGWYYRWAGLSRGAIHSVAVLPFENADGDPTAEYLGDGIAESLINSLSQLPNLKVMSRDSAFHYRGKETDARTVGQVLGVQAVFKGRVVQQGDTLTISAELIDAHHNSHIWGQQYSRKPSDIFALQEEIAKEMTAALRVRLTGEEEKRLRKTYTASAEAYDDYLKGRYWWNKQTEEGFRKGLEYLERAIAKDPAYALAHAGLADCYISLASSGLVSASEGYSKGREWAQKALKLDDTLIEAHVSLASVKTDYEWDWVEGEREALRAIELNPNDAAARAAHAELLWTTGRFDESIQETKRALELDPLSINYNTALAFTFFLARRYDEAIEQGAKILELDPKFIQAYYVRGVAYVKKSMYKEAMAEFEKAVSISPDDLVALTGLGYGYAVTGRRVDAEKVLARLSELSKREFVSPVWMAKIYSGLREKDKAFKALERAYDDRSIVSVAYIKTNPMLDPLRSDPRFADLLRRMNLQP